jgi:hypothetical protein
MFEMDKIDFKKTDKELYLPKKEPSVVFVPVMKFIMVDGCGNPNEPDGEYQKAVGILYSLLFTIKMGRKFGTLCPKEKDFTDYTVPPLEGLWWLNDDSHIDFSHKEKFCWTAMLRQPDFITDELFQKAKEEVTKKKPELDVAKARLQMFEERLCVQCMHNGPYDEEPATIKKIEDYIRENGLADNISTVLSDGNIRRHHEIYLKDPTRTKPENLRTVLRHPVKKQGTHNVTTK